MNIETIEEAIMPFECCKKLPRYVPKTAIKYTIELYPGIEKTYFIVIAWEEIDRSRIRKFSGPEHPLGFDGFDF